MSQSASVTSFDVNGVRIEAVQHTSRNASDRTILFLHPGTGIEPDAPVLTALAKGGRVLAPSHPGFGNSERPRHIATVDDLSYLYLDFLEQQNLTGLTVVGVGLGGWIAAAIAIKDAKRFSRLVMANAIGVKLGDRETRDIADIWSLQADEYDAMAFHDPKLAARDYKALPEQASITAARNREAYARYAWSPYMHDPKLRHRLHRVRVPTLFLWGMSDRILSEDYGRGFCALIPGATFEPIAQAGHLPHVEQPEQLAQKVLAFADGAARR